VPVLLVSPGMPLGHPSTGDGYLHEVKDHSAALAAIAAYSHRVTAVEEIPAAVAAAFVAMRTGRARPAYIEIPLDLLDRPAEVDVVSPPAVLAASPAPAAVEAARALLGTAAAPVIIAGGGPLVRVDVDAIAVVTNAAPDVAVVADAALGLDAILAALGKAPGDGGPAAARAAQWRVRFRADAHTEGAPWLPIVDAIASTLGRDGVLAGDSAMVCYYGALSNLPAYRPASFLYPTGLGTLGYGLPAAIGAKVAQPDARVMALHGDGGVMFTLPELSAAAELGHALPVVVVDNGGYGEIRAEMAARGDDVQAVDFASPDFAAVAVAFGCDGVRLSSAAELAPALEKAFSASRPTVLHVDEQSS
jgi:thiamine pyrophosphate-dependent acetolactate synthase large subunit-like protein